MQYRSAVYNIAGQFVTIRRGFNVPKMNEGVCCLVKKQGNEVYSICNIM
jgi:hypothetical protein